MAGIYIHIPFCRSRCIYCDFYSQTDHSLQESYVDALILSILNLREEILQSGKKIQTVYIGGGTPSLLSLQQLERITDCIERNIVPLSQLLEFTLEANPEDIFPEKVRGWKSCGISRVSIGIQSFSDKILRFLRRAHTAQKALDALEILQREGIENVSLDLIFALPGVSYNDWKENVDRAILSGCQHISCYGLQYEPDTPISKMKLQGTIQEATEDEYIAQYAYLIEKMELSGWEHYEISNFARPPFRSVHNSSYWSHEPYWGIGASAHGFDGRRRYSNVADIHRYIQLVDQKKSTIDFEETLQEIDFFNEMVMLGLRKKEGINLSDIRHQCPNVFSTSWWDKVENLTQEGYLIKGQESVRLTHKGILASDNIILSLFEEK